MENSRTYKMYKDGKKWVVGAVAVAGLMAIQAGTTQASADEVQSNADNSASTAAATQDNGLQADQVTLDSSTDNTATQVSVSSPDEGKQVIDDKQSEVNNSVSDAENNGVIINHNDEQDVHLNDDNYQDETDKVLNDLSDQQNAIDEANKVNQANNDAYDQAQSDRDDAITQGEQDLNDAKDNQQEQIDDSKESGVDTTVDNQVIVPDYEDLTGLTGQDLLDAMARNIARYENAIQEAVANTNSDTAKLKELTDAYNEQMAQYQAEKARIEKENADKQAAYEDALKDFLNGTDVTVNMDARTDSDMEEGQYQTFMTAEVNSETGEFTLKHDMNDGVSIIGRGELTGRIIFTVVSNGDGTETITVTGIELYTYKYTNLNHNTANNKNINFHVYDSNGNELYSVVHDGETSFEDSINQIFALDNVFTLIPGQQSDSFAFLRIEDNWIYNTHGQVFINFQNSNVQPQLPDYEQLPTEPEKVIGHVTNYDVTPLPEAEAPTPQEVTVTPYNVIVDPEPETPVETPAETPAQASLPETGMEAGAGVTLAGFALLSSLGLLGASKKRKKNENI